LAAWMDERNDGGVPADAAALERLRSGSLEGVA
jgi:hypothetical protein